MFPDRQRLPFFYGWVIVAVAFCVSFLSFGMFTYVKGIFLPELAEAFQTGRYEITLGFTIDAVVAGLIAPVMGWFLDRRSPKTVLLFGLTLVVFGYLGLSRVQTLWQFYCVMGLGFGVGLSCLGAFTVQRITISWFLRRRGLALSLVILGASTSGMVMPAVCVWLLEIMGWRDALVALACLVGVVLFPLTLIFLRDTPAAMGTTVDGVPVDMRYEKAQQKNLRSEEDRQWSAPEVLKQPSFWNIVLVFGVIMCVFTAVTMHAFGHITDIGFSTYQAAGALFAMTLCAAIGKPILGTLTDRFGVRIALWTSLVLLAGGLTLLAHVDSLTGIMVGMACFGFGYAGMLPLRSFSVAATVGQSSFGLGNGMLILAILPLSLVASPFAAKVYDLSGSYSMAFQLLVFLVAVAAIGPFFIRSGLPVETESTRSVASH
ncbi:MAG: MFS transporter [Proteobacteria bacterium]|nr:MFS transporter [Pseudomonadota bacterium]